MRKLLVLLGVLLIASFAVNSYAAEGDEFSTTSFRINGSGQVVMKRLVEEATTSDTVEAGESGKTFLVTPAAKKQVKFTLPTAAAGLTYTFIQTIGDNAGDRTFMLDPASTDKFVGCVNSATVDSFAVGDALESPGATGDTVTIVGNTLYWYCSSRVGTFTDNGTSNN